MAELFQAWHLFRSLPRDIQDVHSVGVEDRFHRVVHWMVDPHSGRPWGVAEAVAASFDLATRKMVPISATARARARGRITPGLAL